MARRAGLHWSRPPAALARACIAHGEQLRVSVLEFAETLATIAEREAKRNAPWRDRTGAARRQLHAFVEAQGPGRGDRFRVVLAHGVPYGLWLEIKQAGRWAIILPTLERLAPAWAAFLRSIGF